MRVRVSWLGVQIVAVVPHHHQAEVLHRDQPWTGALDHKSLLFVPLRMDGQIVGAITLAWTSGVRKPYVTLKPGQELNLTGQAV